jgi:hypothetical protein
MPNLLEHVRKLGWAGALRWGQFKGLPASWYFPREICLEVTLSRSRRRCGGKGPFRVVRTRNEPYKSGRRQIFLRTKCGIVAVAAGEVDVYWEVNKNNIRIRLPN